MKNYSIALLLILIVIGSLFIGCDVEVPAVLETGTLSIVFEPEVTIKGTTYKPDISMKVKTFSISGKGPENRTVGPVVSSGEAVTFQNLYKGNWTITVLGLNEQEIAIGYGTNVVAIEPGKTKSVEIDVIQYTDEGTLDITLSWPNADVKDPQVSATMSEIGSNQTTIATIVVDKASGTASYSGTFPAGNYTLQLVLYEGSSANINNKIYGSASAVRIVTDNTTSVTVPLDGETLRVYGKLSVRVTNGIPDPFEVSLTPSSTTIRGASTARFVATPDLPGDYAFSWYLDGELQIGETTDTFTFPNSPALQLGTHSVDVIVSRNGISASDSARLVVLESPETYINIKIRSIETNEIVDEFMLEYGVENYFDINADPLAIPIIGPLTASKMVFSSSEESYTALIGIDGDTPFSLYGNPPENASLLFLEFPSSEGEFTNSGYEQREFILAFFSSANNFDSEAIGFNPGDENDQFQLTINSYGNVGGVITGSILANNTAIFAYDESFDSIPLIGNYKIEIEFEVKRAEDIRFYQLTYNGDGAVGDGPNSTEIPKNFRIDLPGNYDGNTFTKSGYTFTGWNTRQDGNGTFYGEGDSFSIPDHDVTLYAVWEEPYVGNSGSLVFYDKGNDDGGWRYLEAASEDILVGSTYEHIFGYKRNSSTGETELVGTQQMIGTGKINTEALVNAMGNVAYISRDTEIIKTTNTYAAKLCADYAGGGHSDWFLPSKAELNQMYQNLKTAGLGDFSDADYWSSSESKYSDAVKQSFSDGRVSDYSNNNEHVRIRPIRAYK